MSSDVKHSLNAFGLLKQLNVSDSLYDWLHYSGYLPYLTSSKFYLAVKDGPHSKDAPYVPIAMSQMYKLTDGTLHAGELSALRTAVEHIIKDVKAHIAKTKWAHPDDKIDPYMSPASAMSILPPASQDPAAVTTPVGHVPPMTFPNGYGKWGAIHSDYIGAAATMHLSKATKLYQPVFGTDASSVYHLVAACETLRVAVRWAKKDSKLSVRIDGSVSANSKSILAAGFTKASHNSSNSHASVHLHCTNKVMARRSLGALLGGLCKEWETPPYVWDTIPGTT